MVPGAPGLAVSGGPAGEPAYRARRQVPPVQALGEEPREGLRQGHPCAAHRRASRQRRYLNQRVAVEAGRRRVGVLRREFVCSEVFVRQFEQDFEVDGDEIVASNATRLAGRNHCLDRGQLLAAERFRDSTSTCSAFAIDSGAGAAAGAAAGAWAETAFAAPREATTPKRTIRPERAMEFLGRHRQIDEFETVGWFGS